MIYLILPIGNNKDVEEANLIESFLKWQNIQYKYGFHKDESVKYYKGSGPAILIFNKLDKEPEVIYGFLNLVKYMDEYGMLLA